MSGDANDASNRSGDGATGDLEPGLGEPVMPADAPAALCGSGYQQMVPGAVLRTAWRTVTEADLCSFVNLFGFNEPLFMDARGPSDAGYAGRLVPGAFTYSIAEGLIMQTGLIHGTGMAFLGMTLDVHGPVFVGDHLCAVHRVDSVRPTSGGGRAVVGATVWVFNQDEKLVLTYLPKRMIRSAD